MWASLGAGPLYCLQREIPRVGTPMTEVSRGGRLRRVRCCAPHVGNAARRIASIICWRVCGWQGRSPGWIPSRQRRPWSRWRLGRTSVGMPIPRRERLEVDLGLSLGVESGRINWAAEIESTDLRESLGSAGRKGGRYLACLRAGQGVLCANELKARASGPAKNDLIYVAPLFPERSASFV